MDPTDNPVVALCVEGMQREGAGHPDAARRSFERAWASAGDDYERCVAAHYLARHQDGPHQSLEWNERCLALADRVADDRVAAFYPSLYLNIGKSHEELGERQAAQHSYQLAAAVTDRLPQDGYGQLVRNAITRGLNRTAGA